MSKTGHRAKHAGIFGQSESGKTFLAQSMARAYRSRGFPILVCDPFEDPGWPADFLTADIGDLIDQAHRAVGCIIFVDEAGQCIGLNPPKEVEWLTTGSRHRGHLVRICGQRGVMVSKTMRDQLSELYLFNVDASDAEDWARCFAEPRLRQAPRLPQYHFFRKARFQACIQGRLTADGKI